MIRSLYLYVIGFDLVAIGLLSMVATLVGAFRSAAIGLLADRYGKKIFLVLGGVLSAVRLLIYAFFADFAFLVVAQIIGALSEGGGAGQPAVSGLIADKTSRETRVKAFTMFALTNSSAAILGSLLASTTKSLQAWLMMTEPQSFQLLFLVCAFISAASSAFIVPIEEQADAGRNREKSSLLPKKSVSTISRFSLVRAIGGFGFGITWDLIGPWFKIQFNVGEEVLGPTYAASRLLVLLLYVSTLRFAPDLDEVKSLALSRLVSAAVVLFMPFVGSYLAAAVLLAAYRVSLMLTMPMRQSFITTIVDPSERSSAVGISNLSRMSVRSFAPAVGGYMMENLSMSLPFAIGAGVIALNGLAYYVFFGKGKQTAVSSD